MSDETLMKGAIISMLPKGAAWEIAPDGELDHLLDGIGDGLETVREDVGRVGDVRNPLTTPFLSDLETDLGVVPEPDISEATRRAYLNSIKNEKPRTGSDDHLETALIAAGFDVIVVRNDPPVDPASILMGTPIATCGDPTKTCGDADTRCGMTGDGELLVNGDSVTSQEPLYTATCGDATATCGDAETTCGAFLSMRREYYNYPIPSNPARWPFFFWVCGGIAGLDDLIDWNMEMNGADNWVPGGGANISKSHSVLNSGIRSLRVGASGADLGLQQTQPANPDADLQSFYRMDDVGAGVVENLAWKNELVDGNMEKPGTDVIADGDMEITGPDVIVDGDMEAVGVGAYSAQNGATLTKDVTDPHGGVRCLRVAYNGVAIPYAQQIILTIGKTYRAKGWARGDGTAYPSVKSNGGSSLWLGTTSTSWQEFDFVFVAPATDFRLQAIATAPGYCEFDDLEVIDETVACAAWTAGSSATLTKDVTDPHSGAQCLRVEYGGGINPFAHQAILTIGKTYRVKGWARGDGNAYPRIDDNSGLLFWNGTTSTSWQYFDVVNIPTNAIMRFRGVNASSAGKYVEFDDVEVIDETVACAAWTKHNSALLSKQGDAYEAAQCLRVEKDGTNTPTAYQTILTIAKTYRVKGRARSDGNAGSIPRLGDSGGANPWNGVDTHTDWQEFNFIYMAWGTQLSFYNNITTDTHYVEFDDVYVIDLDAGCSDWTPGVAATLSKRHEDPYDGLQSLRITYDGAVAPFVRQTVMNIGSVYRVTGWARGDGAVGIPLIMEVGQVLWVGTISSDYQYFDVTFTALTTNFHLVLNNVAASWCEFDQVLLNKVVGGNPTLNPNAGNANGVNVETPWIKGLEFDGATAKIDANAVNLAMSMENMTMIGWFNLADYTAPATQGLITNGSVGADRQGLYIDAGLIRYVCVSGTAKIIDTGVALPYQNNWRTRIGVTRSYDGGETILKLYVNGAEKDTLTFRGAPDVTLTQAWIGWLTGASFFNGTASDNVSLFNSGKSAAYMLADYEDGIGTMLEGPYAEQIVDPITTERPLDGFAWGVSGTNGIPMIYVLDTDTDEWSPVYIGTTGSTKQTISETLDNIGGIRLYAKNTERWVFFDDISINDPIFTQAEIPSKLRDKFRKLVLKAKRLGTYAGLLINWTGDAP